MRVILGIGNPGSRYHNNRHNVGFMFLDYLAKNYDLEFISSKKQYLYAQGNLGDDPFVLVKPSTFVNNSGIAAADCLTSFNAKHEDILVIFDDLNLSPARIRIKAYGGGSGHNGVLSIIHHLNSEKFPRLRIGIGRNFERGRMAEYVLSDLDDEEKKSFYDSFQGGKILAEEFIKGGLQKMLDLNSKIINEMKSLSATDVTEDEGESHNSED